MPLPGLRHLPSKPQVSIRANLKSRKQQRTYGFRFTKTVRRRQVVGAVAVGHLVELLALLNRAENPET